MTQQTNNTKGKIMVAIDIAKVKNDVLIELSSGQKKRMQVYNRREDYDAFYNYLNALKTPCVIAFEATGNYHRPIAYFLQSKGFELCLISSIASAKSREALYNSWDKNDRKDTHIILHLLKTGLTQVYHDPLLNQYNDVQEISKTHHQVSLRKVKIQHSIMTHYLPLYFPEATQYFHSSRALWFSSLLLRFPTPSVVMQYSEAEFINEAWDVAGRKVNKENWLKDFYKTAKNSIGVLVSNDSQAVKMFRVTLQEHIDLCQLRNTLEETAVTFLKERDDYQRLITLPGVGPIIALTILAEAGDLHRFKHYRQFLKFCGFDLSTQQSGNFKGHSKLSKRGNSRLRQAFWLAATVAIRIRENTFRKKFSHYIKKDPENADLKRKGYTAVAAKMARVAYSLVTAGTEYQCFYEAAIPSGKIPSVLP